MQNKLLTAASLMAVAGVISACNSTDASYSQGPWGPGHVRRNYPEYSAPWGGRLPASPEYAIGGPVIAAANPIELDMARPERRREVHLEADIGPAPTTQDIGIARPSDQVILAAPTPITPDRPSRAANPAPADSQSSPPGIFTAPQRASSYAGTWNARVGASSCKVQLSSVPSLDLYKASTQGCTHETMRSVNGWSFRENQVILFSRGQLVARLSGAEAALAGTLNSSGSEIRMSR
ncbi:AprI/Inh family metalloprotease inhibitor [Microvirga sp. VF16]|uniref:AprI/Inh family metalloprotease inhibitor n=1 Tax=Microvirga sp. VF16 TaxID=2807101 RepID=UPI00193D40BE|nr:AprI/Inh family metalloprotease inhibitor [Microvirga sp. VF16]QRM30141.1 AprI/Inh family metalloprotease inhibitor [Microvirga sp. VF16]